MRKIKVLKTKINIKKLLLKFDIIKGFEKYLYYIDIDKITFGYFFSIYKLII